MTKTERERARKHLYKQPGSANWFLRFYLHGKQVRETTGTPDETEACRVALARLDEAGADRSGAKKFIGPEQKKITVQQLLDALKLNYEIRGKSGARLLSNLKPLEEWFGYYKAIDLQGADLDHFIKHAQEHGRRKSSTKPAQPASINRSLQLLGQAYKLAKKDGILNHEPPTRRQSEVGNARQGFFDAADFYRVLSQLPTRYRDFTLFAYLTGWRRGEIQKLSWSDIDGDSIKLRAMHSKNRTARSVPLVGELAELIERRRQARPVPSKQEKIAAVESVLDGVPCNNIFHSAGQPVGDFRKAWHTACIMAGVGKLVCPKATCENANLDAEGKCAKCGKTWNREERKYVGKLFHDLRRSAVRDMVRSGTPQAVAMSISGHKTPSVFQRYNITDDADQRQALLNRQTYAQQRAEEKPVTELVQ
jgi:integrase